MTAFDPLRSLSPRALAEAERRIDLVHQHGDQLATIRAIGRVILAPGGFNGRLRPEHDDQVRRPSAFHRCLSKSAGQRECAGRTSRDIQHPEGPG